MSERKKPSGIDGIRRGVANPGPVPEPVTGPVYPAELRPVPAAKRVSARPARPVKPVRVTLDLDPAVHLFLREFATAAGVKASPVLRALLAELKADKQLAERVRGRVYSG